MAQPPPPPPPPHGERPRPPGGLPDGNYDIFIIPPHSAGSGFLYLPSLQPHRNSFLAGVACTLLAVAVWTIVMPVLKQWLATVVASGGIGVLLLVAGVGVAAWAFGKTQGEGGFGGSGPAGGAGAQGNKEQHQKSYAGPPPQPDGYAHANGYAQPPQPEPQPQPKPSTPRPSPGAASGWEKAREETRKREEERKRAEELKKKREEAQRMREEAERKAKAEAEKLKWEQARAREKETREREARERIARERAAREKDAREKDTREREAREAKEKASSSGRASPTKPAPPSPDKSSYQQPTARSYVGTEDEHSFRPYDTAPKSRPTHTFKSSASSVSGLSESSYAPSQSTARTTPPPSHRGPYSTKDPDKIQIKAVYLFSDSFPGKPTSQLVSGVGSVTDGLILRIKTEGLFIDDDVRGVPQREWDVKAWTLKLVEDGKAGNTHVFRATTRDVDNKKYTFILEESEAWKVAIGLQSLRKGSQVRSLGMNGMKEPEVNRLLSGLGWA